MLTMRKNIYWVLLLAAGVFFFGSLQASGQFFFMKNENIGKPVKEFNLKLLGGKEASLTDFREGKKAIVFFWATWCPHCRTELSKLNEKKSEIDSLGIKLVLVDVGESSEVVAQYFDKNKIDMDVFLDEKNEAAETYEVMGVPTFYFVGEDGIVRDVTHSLPKNIEDAFYGAS